MDTTIILMAAFKNNQTALVFTDTDHPSDNVVFYVGLWCFCCFLCMIQLYTYITATDKKVLSRVTSLELSCSRLWVGTGNGNIISIPLNIGQ